LKTDCDTSLMSSKSQLHSDPAFNYAAADNEKHEDEFVETPTYGDESLSEFVSGDLHEAGEKTTEICASEQTSATDFVLQLREFLFSLDDSSESIDIDFQLQDFASRFCEGLFWFLKITLLVIVAAADCFYVDEAFSSSR
jgi:hypothetical protein